MSTRAKHVLLVISSLGRGGAERVIVDLCDQLLAAGFRVTLLTLMADEKDAYRLPANVGRERLHIGRNARSIWDTIRFTVSQLMQIRQRIASIRPDVIISFIDQTNVRMIVSTLGMGIPTIVSERTHPGHHWISAQWRTARRLTYRFASCVVVQTDEAADWVRQNVPTRRLEVVPNAVRSSLDHADGAVPARGVGEFRLMAVGRLVHVKGYDMLVSAFARSGIIDMGWHLTILGEGEERASLSSQIEELGIDEAVDLAGHQGSVGAWLQTADMFVLPSRYEGFPNALLEAMQAGVPSIAFDCPGGVAEIIEPEKNGVLVPAENIDGLAAALLRLAQNAGLRKTLGEQGKKVNDRLAPSVVYARWIELIREFTEAGRP